MNKRTALGCALLLALTACPEARFHTSRTLSVSLPAPAGQSRVSLSVKDAEAQDALRLIDRVLVADGFAPDPNRPVANEPGLIASYAKFDGTGLRRVGTPDVYLRGERLEVVFVELGNRSGHLKATNKILNLLRKELINRYGSKSVKVED
jgi:hypothetical protein